MKKEKNVMNSVFRVSGGVKSACSNSFKVFSCRHPEFISGVKRLVV